MSDGSNKESKSIGRNIFAERTGGGPKKKAKKEKKQDVSAD